MAAVFYDSRVVKDNRSLSWKAVDLYAICAIDFSSISVCYVISDITKYWDLIRMGIRLELI